MDDFKKAAVDAAADASEKIDKGISSAVDLSKQGVAVVAGAASQAIDEGQKVWEQSKVRTRLRGVAGAGLACCMR